MKHHLCIQTYITAPLFVLLITEKTDGLSKIEVWMVINYVFNLSLLEKWNCQESNFPVINFIIKTCLRNIYEWICNFKDESPWNFFTDKEGFVLFLSFCSICVFLFCWVLVNISSMKIQFIYTWKELFGEVGRTWQSKCINPGYYGNFSGSWLTHD